MIISRDICVCGNIPGTLVNESYCNKPCDGDPNKVCGSGSPLHNSVFGTRLYVQVSKFINIKLTFTSTGPKPLQMEGGQTGLHGVLVNQIVGSKETEPVTPPLLFLVELIVLETKLS